MAKKGTRIKNLVLECSICGGRNYVTERSNIQPVTKLEINKYCKTCKERKIHKESK